ncbi:MAG: gamma-glutamylcyclotransferase [Planctomycetes bacterium]|nr:gamma-glutamylcyclotransferase [Planctomycetota bacterium]
MLQLPLFVFGTLRQSECNHGYLAGAYDRVLPARLPGFSRVAPLMIAREANSVVDGELYFLSPATYAATLSGCDQLEELASNSLIGHEYHRIAVRAVAESVEFIAWAYVRPDVVTEDLLLPLIAIEQERIQHL